MNWKWRNVAYEYTDYSHISLDKPWKLDNRTGADVRNGNIGFSRLLDELQKLDRVIINFVKVLDVNKYTCLTGMREFLFENRSLA